MPSTYSSRFRLNFQAPGDNLNTWGLVLNSGVFQLLEDAVAKRIAFALSGSADLRGRLLLESGVDDTVLTAEAVAQAVWAAVAAVNKKARHKRIVSRPEVQKQTRVVSTRDDVGAALDALLG